MRFGRTVLGVAGIAAGIWAVVLADGRSVIDADSAPLVSLALAVVIAGCVAGWWLGSDTPPVGAAVQLAGTLIGVGTLRELHLGADAVRWLSVAHWVGLALLAAATVGVLRDERRQGRGSPSVVTVAAVIWALTTVIGEIVRGLPDDLILQPGSSSSAIQYRSWASALSLGLPLGTTLWLIGALAYLRLIRPRLGRSDRGDLVIDANALDVLESSLATWIADPSVQIGFAAGAGSWIDHAGRPFLVPTTPDRSVTVLTEHGDPLAVLVSDPRLAARPGLVEFAATVAGSAVRADRDGAVAESRVVAARRLSSDLLRSDDLARSELIADLRSGPCATLHHLADDTRQGGDLVGVAEGVRAITADVRRMSHGVHPPELETYGLAAALPGARWAPGRRFPRAVEVTAYLLAHDEPEAEVLERDGRLVVSGVTTPIPGPIRERLAVLDARIDGGTVELPLMEA